MELNFDDLGKRLVDTVDGLGKKAGDTLEIEKIKSEIRTLKRENERDYIEIGKMVYEQFRSGEMADTSAVSICGEIEKRLEQIEECESRIARVKGE